MKHTKKLVVSAVLIAVMMVLGMTRLGFIPVGAVNATTLHIPVLIAALLFDAKIGVLLGACFGAYSMANAFLHPTPLSFLFMNPLVAIVPRLVFPLVAVAAQKGLAKLSVRARSLWLEAILGGLSVFLVVGIFRSARKGWSVGLVVSILLLALVAGAFFYCLRRRSRLDVVFLSALLATMAHTVMVLGMIWVLYLGRYASALGITPQATRMAILTAALVNGLPEAMIGATITSAVALRFRKER